MSAEFQEIPVEKVKPNPYQPRTHFPSKEQRELKESIKKNGLIQPVVLRKTEDGFEILAGERRFKAVQDLGFPTVTAIVKTVSDDQMRTLSLLENIQREDLSPIEEARTYKALLEHGKMSQEQLAAKIGKDRSTIANTMRLLALPFEIQEDVVNRRLSMGHARSLLAIKERGKILILRDEIINKKLNVRQTEKLVKKNLRKSENVAEGKSDSPPVKPSSKDSTIRDFEEKLSNGLGTKVEIWGDGKEGSIQIHFSSPLEFNRLFNFFTDSFEDEETEEE